MTSHTPGPWWIVAPAYGHKEIVADGPKGQLELATVHFQAEYGFLPQGANARLIAYAPDLLAELKRAVELCNCSVTERLSGHLIECPAPRWIELIAKVEDGRPS